MYSERNDLGSVIAAKCCGATNAVAAGTGDNTAVTGKDINRKTKGGVGFDTCSLALAYRTTLTADKTLSFQVEVQEADDNGSGAAGSYATATVLQASTVQETGAGTNVKGVLEIKDTGFKSRKQWVRYNFTPDLSHSGTDTVDCALVAILGGPDSMPA